MKRSIIAFVAGFSVMLLGLSGVYMSGTLNQEPEQDAENAQKGQKKIAMGGPEFDCGKARLDVPDFVCPNGSDKAEITGVPKKCNTSKMEVVWSSEDGVTLKEYEDGDDGDDDKEEFVEGEPVPFEDFQRVQVVGEEDAGVKNDVEIKATLKKDNNKGKCADCGTAIGTTDVGCKLTISDAPDQMKVGETEKVTVNYKSCKEKSDTDDCPMKVKSKNVNANITNEQGDVVKELRFSGNEDKKEVFVTPKEEGELELNVSGECCNDTSKTIVVKADEGCNPGPMVLASATNDNDQLKPENYTSVGKSVEGKEFEIEQGDVLTLKAKGSPKENQKYVWSTGKASKLEINGSRIGSKVTLKEPQDADVGPDNTVCVKCMSSDKTGALPSDCSGADVSTKIHVNDNLEAGFHALTISKGKSWAHVGDEEIELFADGTDHDWFDGELDESKNQIDLSETKWTVPPEFGELKFSKGKKTKFQPSKDSKTGQTKVTARFEDKSDDYSPRDEGSENGSRPRKQIKVGVFKVKVESAVTVAGGGGDQGTTTSKIVELEEKEGDVKSTHTGSLSASIPAQGKTITLTETDNMKVLIEWTFGTVPDDANPKGFITADLTAGAGSATFEGTVEDGDLFDDPVSISFGVSLGSGISLDASIGTKINTEDTDEGIATLSTAFKTTGGFTEGLPKDSSNNLQVKSSDYTDLFDPLANPDTEVKDWTFPKQTVEHKKKKGQSVKAIFIFNAHSKVILNKSIIGTRKLTLAKSLMKNIKVMKNFSDVGYEPSPESD